MKVLKRIFCILLSVTILFFGVSNSYLSPVKMDKVHAAETIILSEEIARLICEYFGAMTYGYASADEAKPNITTDDLAKLGHEFIKGLYDVNGIPPEVADVQKELIENKQALGMLSYLGQSYVFGSEALQEVAGMDFSVIQGGGDDEDPDEESKLKKFAKSAFCLTMSGALAVSQVLPLVATELMNENPTEYEQNNPEYKFAGYDDCYIPDAQQYNIRAYAIQRDPYSYSTWEISTMEYKRLHLIGSPTEGYKFCLDNGDVEKVTGTFKYYYNGKLDNKFTRTDYSASGSSTAPSTITANIPIYPTHEAWKVALASGDFTGASNYNRVYPIADWLKEDWSGVLYDPLTGLNTGADWFTLVRQGLASASSVGEDVNEETYRNGLRDYFKDARENRDEANAPYIDPALAPIYLPATMPEVKIDPDADIAVSPSTDPEPNPDPVPLPDPVSPGDLSDDMENIVDYVPTLADSLTDFSNELKKKFPFSIPWDIHYILSGLATAPKAPRFELPLKVERIGIDETIVVDMKRFQVLSDLSRSIFSLLFAIGLINLTIRIIGSLKEE